MNVRIKNPLLPLLAAALAAAGCGGSDGSVPPPPPPPASLTVTSSAPTAPVGTSVTITANVLAAGGSPVNADTAVTFAASGGTLSGATRTDAAGNATASLTSAVGGTVTVFASVGTLPARTVAVTFVDPDAPSAVVVAAETTGLVGLAGVALAAHVSAAGGGPVPAGTPVSFAVQSGSGTLSADSATTDAAGDATVILRSAVEGSVTVVASAAGPVSGSVTVAFTTPPAAPASLEVGSSAPTALVGASVTVTASVLRADGSPVNANTPVTFAATGGTLTGSGRTDAVGNATVSLTSAVGGPITVFVSVGALAPRTVVVTFVDPNVPFSVAVAAAPASAVVGSSVLLTATVRPAGADGAGGPGGAVANGTTVDFVASAGAVGSVTTTTGGEASAVLGGVTTPTLVSVTAFVGGIASLPVLIAFEDPSLPGTVAVTALPAAGFVGPSGVAVTARVLSLGGGPVAAGTPVSFAVRSGTGTLSAGTASADAGGEATVTLRSAAEGSVTVAAVAGGTVSGTVTVAFTDPGKPGAIALAASPGSGVTQGGRTVTLTATVTPADPANGAIADGTPVTFTIASGSGTLSAATAGTLGGVASVTLDAAVAGTVAVSARAGSAPVVTSPTVSVPFVGQPGLAVVKVGTTGALAPGVTIGGVSAVVRASPSAGLSLAAGDVAATGAGTGAMLVANVADVAAEVVAVISTTGMAAGEFATLTFHVAPGAFPAPGDFSAALTGAGVVDTSGATIPLGVGIVSVTIQ